MRTKSIQGRAGFRAVTLIAAASLFALSFTSNSMAAEATVSLSEVTTSASKSQSPARASRYWTPQRMRQAVPLDVAPVSPNLAKAAAEVPEPPVGPPGSVGPVRPNTKKLPRLKRGPVRAAVPRASQASYRRFEMKKTKSYPIRTHGKVFFKKQHSRLGYVCSATVITTAAKNIVVTAGHCVHGGKGKSWHRKMVFVPGYRHVGREQRPYGTFAAYNMIALKGWTSYSDWDYDFALIELARNGAGQKVQNAVGSRGIAWNQSRNQFFKAFGYPADKPFFGGRLYRCDSRYSGYGQGKTMGIGCDMTGGSSGGGWVIGNEYVNSVNSYGFTFQPEMMYGPYFGSSFFNLFADYRE